MVTSESEISKNHNIDDRNVVDAGHGKDDFQILVTQVIARAEEETQIDREVVVKHRDIERLLGKPTHDLGHYIFDFGTIVADVERSSVVLRDDGKENFMVVDV